MNDTIGQNGVSSSHLSAGHRHHGSIPHTPARQDEPHHRSSTGSSNQPSALCQPVSDHEGKENERFQNREILLKLLQPPGATMMHAQCGSRTLPHQESEKTLFKPELCGSHAHCLRCTSLQHAPRKIVDIGREANEEWNQKTWHSNCIISEIKGQKQNIFTNRNKTESNFRHRDTVAIPGKNLPRPDTERTSLFPTMVRCQSCDVTSRARPFRSEELQLHPDGSQHYPADHQQHSNGHPCFRGKETGIHDPKSATLHQGTGQIGHNIPIQINGKLPRKDQGNLKHMCHPSTWGYQNCDSWKCQHPPPSSQTLVQDHSEMPGITSAGKRTDIVLTDTDRLPDHFRPVEGGKDVVCQMDTRTRQGPSPTTPDKLEDHQLNSSSSYSMCSSGSYRREMFHPSGKWNSPVARIDNGQEHCHEERNRSFEKPSESDHQTLPHSPNESSHVIETQSDECTPVIVQCYSLSTVSPILEPTSMSDSAHFMITQKTDASVNIGNGDPPVPVSNSRCLYQQHSSKSHKSASYLQGNEDVLYNCPTAGPRSSTNPHNHKFVTQPRHAMDESSTPELAVDDEQNQTHSTTLPGQFHKRCTIPPSFPCLNCQPGQRTFKNGYDVNCTQTSRRDHHPYNNQWSEPHRNASHNVSGQGVIHVPNDYPRTRSAVDMRDGRADSHTPGETFRNWHARQVPRESRPALKIHDYYEERRILVGKVYQDIPGSVESAESNQNSAIPYARAREEYQKDHHQNGATSAEVFQASAGEEGALQICAHQSKIAVGSKKRKSRQPRPQRVKTSDPALERETYQHQIQYAEDCQEEFSHNSYHQNALTSKETFRNRGEDAGVRVNESEMYSYEPVHEPTDPVQPESGTRREDHAFENSSSRPEFCRKEIPTETHSPWRIQFHDKRINKVPAERCDPLFEYPREPCDVPSYGPIGRHHRISREYQTNSYCQSKTPHKFVAYSNGNVTKRPFNSSPEGNTTHQHWHGPIWTRDPEKHFETLEKTRNGYDSTHASCSSRMLMSYSGPSQRNMPTDNNVTSQFERDCESSWNDPATSVHGEHQDNSFVHHAGSAKGKSPHNSSKMHSSLPSVPSDNGSVSSTTVDDMVEPQQEKHGSDRPFQSIGASAILDRGSGQMKEQNTAFSENRGFYLNTREVLANNYMAAAMKEKRFLCRYCSKKFAHFSTLQNHLRTHTGDKPFQCKFCSRRFAQSGVLKAHLRTHTGDKPFACMYCGKDFAQSTTLTNHLRTHTGQKPYICQFCTKSFSQPSTLRKHELSHTKERPYPCKFCGKAFAQQSTLTNHMRSHTGQRPYKCHFCDKSFAQLSTLDRHLRLHSSVSLKPHQCQYCSKSFSYFSNLTSHMQIHEQEQT